MKKTGGFTPKELIFGIIGLIIFLIFFTLVFRNYKGEANKNSVELIDNDHLKNYVDVAISITGVDPVAGEINLRVIMTPKGIYSNDKGRLTQELNVYINAVSNKQEYNFQEDKLMSPIDATLSLYDGLPNDYPFDKHKSNLFFYVETKVKKDSTGRTIEGDAIPVQMDFVGSMQGYLIDAQKGEKTNEETNVVYMEIERSLAVKFFSIFVCAAMWFLCGIVLFMTLSVIVRGRKIELNMFAFMSALIFALPSLRNIQPMTPPIGTIMDYIAFFWAEGLVALCLVIIVFSWLLRPGVKELKVTKESIEKK